MKNSQKLSTGIRGIIALGVFLITAAAAAQENILAIGQVSSGGGLVDSAHSLGAGGTVASATGGTGNYTVTLTAPGAFTGAVGTDFLVQVTCEDASPDDIVAKASISSVNANQLVVRIRTDDVESSADPSVGTANNQSFFFAIYRVPTSFPAKGSTRYLAATGKVESDGSLGSSVGVKGIAVGSSKNGTGDYNVTLTKTGAFAAAGVDDFVIILTVEGFGTQDQAIRGDVTSITNDTVTINVHTDDVQDAGDSNFQTAEDEEFFFTIYRLPAGAGAGLADSKLLIAMGRVIGASGVLSSGGGAFDGSALGSARDDPGEYSITITAPGGFAGKTVDDYVLQLHPNQSFVADETVRGRVLLPDANTLIIDVHTNDVEQTGESLGVATDATFYFFLYDAVASPQPDLRIGTKKNLTRQKGDDIYNATGARQKVRVGLPGTRKKKYFFSLENDGNVSDDIFLKAKRSGNKIKSRYFRLTGGRKNVTAAITSAGHTVDGVPPRKIIKFEAQAKYKKPGKRPRKTLRYLARSQILATQKDVNKATLKPK